MHFNTDNAISVPINRTKQAIASISNTNPETQKEIDIVFELLVAQTTMSRHWILRSRPGIFVHQVSTLPIAKIKLISQYLMDLGVLEEERNNEELAVGFYKKALGLLCHVESETSFYSHWTMTSIDQLRDKIRYRPSNVFNFS